MEVSVANSQYAFIDRERVPSREAWQAAITKSGFDLQLDPELKPFEDSGFSPCTLLGSASGVEIYYSDDPEDIGEFKASP